MEKLNLDKLIDQKKSNLILILGKPGTGKTTLLKKYIDENALYFRADLQHDMVQLPRFIRVFNELN